MCRLRKFSGNLLKRLATWYVTTLEVDNVLNKYGLWPCCSEIVWQFVNDLIANHCDVDNVS